MLVFEDVEAVLHVFFFLAVFLANSAEFLEFVQSLGVVELVRLVDSEGSCVLEVDAVFLHFLLEVLNAGVHFLLELNC